MKTRSLDGWADMVGSWMAVFIMASSLIAVAFFLDLPTKARTMDGAILISPFWDRVVLDIGLALFFICIACYVVNAISSTQSYLDKKPMVPLSAGPIMSAIGSLCVWLALVLWRVVSFVFGGQDNGMTSFLAFVITGSIFIMLNIFTCGIAIRRYKAKQGEKSEA